MRLSLGWLREWIDLDLPAEAIAERLTTIGVAVDGVDRLGAGLDGVVVARVDSVHRHPNADHLVVCEVFDGKARVRVVCGAPNVAAGRTFPLAPVGCALPGGEEVREISIRGQLSQGMLCSERELGISDDHTGLMELAEGAVPGDPLSRHLGLDDVVFELDVSYNRPDWLSVRGIARELAAAFGRTLRAIDSAPREGGVEAGFPLPSISIEEKRDCVTYAARVVRGVRIGPSPTWLRRRLEAIGQRSINNVVDVTNYVLHGYGQPIHAFDLSRLRGSEIGVRRARRGERLVTLDGVDRALDRAHLVIADGEGPVALAGIMGGAASEVHAETTDLLLESAHFDAAVVRAGAAALGMETEASLRFGRGIDADGVLPALDHTARWIQEIAGGECVGGRRMAGGAGAAPRSVALRMRRVETVLGEAVPADEVTGILDRLGFAPEASPDGGGAAWVCRVPGHRLDVEREIDLIEEVARFHGYDRFAPRQYNAAGAAAVREPTERRLARSASVLVGLGFQEIVTSTFASSEEGRATAEWTWASGEPVALLNARSVDASVLRRSLWPEHLRVARRNLNRGATSLRLFEHGKTFGRLPSESWGRERWELSGILVGAREPAGWSGPAVPLDLFALKGILDAYFRRQRLASAEYAPYGGEALDPADAFRFQVPGGIRGVGGRVHPAAALRWDVPRDTWLFSIDFESLLELNEPSACYQEASRFPGVKRDLAFVVPAEVAQRDVREAMIESGGPWLRSVRLFDLYEGAPVPPGHKSLAYSLDFQSGERSLVGQEVDRLVLGIAGRLRERFGAVVREA